MSFTSGSLGVTLETLTGRGHALICNLLIIRYIFIHSVEMPTFFGYVSTLSFITD